MKNQDIRWAQRFLNYKKALHQLENAVELSEKRGLTVLEQQGMVQAFEYTHELAWKTLKDFLEDKGYKDIYGSKDTTRLAFQQGLIQNGDIWMDMIINRNQTSHTYNEDTAEQIVYSVKNKYFLELQTLKIKLDELYKKLN